jgi:hypothetical protein
VGLDQDETFQFRQAPARVVACLSVSRKFICIKWQSKKTSDYQRGDEMKYYQLMVEARGRCGKGVRLNAPTSMM